MKTKKLMIMIVLILVMPLILTACSSFQGQPVGFFEGYGWEDVLGLLFAALFGAFPGFSIFQWLKNKFGWVDQQAHYAVLGLSFVLTFVAMLVTGALDFSNFQLTLDNLVQFGLMFYAASQVAYQRFKSAQAAKLGLR